MAPSVRLVPRPIPRPLALALFIVVAAPAPARALNKQGAPASLALRDEAEARSPVNLAGYVFAGALFYNPSYAARPDNSGRALLRVGGHLELQLYREHLALIYDTNVFSDGTSDNVARPSEHDHIVGLAGRWRFLEVAAHFEVDSPWDRGGLSQSYVDLHGRVYFDAWRTFPALAARLPRQGLSGWLTVAGFLYNESYAARPDLSGLALARLVGHLDLDLLRDWLTLSVDLNFFTDRQRWAGLVPSELDTTVGLALHLRDVDLAVVAENDRPLDRAGIDQTYVSALASWRFDARELAARRRRGHPGATATGASAR